MNVGICFRLETVRVEFYARNTLQVPLLLSDVQLLWKYSSTTSKRKASIAADAGDEPKEFTNDTMIKQVRIRTRQQNRFALFFSR
jgi:hypothetical protein